MSYHPVSSKSDDEVEAQLPPAQESYSTDRRPGLCSTSNILIGLLIVACSSISFLIGKSWSYPPPSQEFPPSPLNGLVDQTLRLTQRNLSYSHPSIYRQDPTTEVDTAWDRLERFNIIRASASDLAQAGSNPHAVPVPNTTDDGYMATLEVVHHMHCLNLLRKSTFVDHRYYNHDPVFHDPKFDIKSRIRACIDTLRQHLTCTADTGLMTYYWIEGYMRAYPNMNTWHMCRDYEGLMQWTDENKVQAPESWEGIWETMGDGYQGPEERFRVFGGPLEGGEHPRPEGL